MAVYRVRIARSLHFRIESVGGSGDLGFRQETLDLAHRRLLHAARRVAGTRPRPNRERIDRSDQSNALRGGSLAA